MAKKNKTTYGLVISGMFYSNRMEFKTSMDNGIYALDMTQDDFRNSMIPADIDEAIRFFRRASKVKVIRGVSFHTGIIPENPVAYNRIPIPVLDGSFEEFEEVEVAIPLNGQPYFLRIVSTEKSFGLMELQGVLADGGGDIDHIKGISPDMRIAYTFHVIEKEREEEERRQEELRVARAEAKVRREAELRVPRNAIRHALENAGATVESIRKHGQNFEAIWNMHGHTISTIVASDYRVLEAGFCMSGYDHTQSVTSVANVLDDYVDQGDYIHKTRGRY